MSRSIGRDHGRWGEPRSLRVPFLETPALQSGLRACHDGSWQISLLIHQGEVGRSPHGRAASARAYPPSRSNLNPRCSPNKVQFMGGYEWAGHSIRDRVTSCDPNHSPPHPDVRFSIPEVKRDLDRRGTAMVRDIAIMIAAIAAIVAFAPKVSGRADHSATEAADTACLKQRVGTPGCLTPRGD
jgi:hypothetical protein